MRRGARALIGGSCLALTAPAFAQRLYVYPQKGQNQQQQDETLNWAIGRHFFDHWFEAALLGYDTFQITNDTGSAVPASSRGAKDQVHAVGVELGVPKLALTFKYFREFGAQDRFEGDVYTLSVALPLDPVVGKIAQLVSP